ncbi:hypothetical protein CROQUDRAFT_667555 [Cronartium quercuum f. sp. fusiforme G11]|uniref:Kri1-like C-terminal domain-containing protein n=1 Tax=Cronartium quercuum f. sp. fusiforme G11 TaxID=708437 RepID=A0A9P6NR49_9BASI|nr:hypothetical protein CROQUDRAFT_667555 [Cronartium quercuum f. sp. fusiforme G11]
MAPIDLFSTVNEDLNLSDTKGKRRAAHNEENGLTFNQSYAQQYESRKRGEELTKLKDKYGPDYDGEETDEDEDLSSEDSDAEFITPEVDAAILKTMAKIKRADPTLYEGDQPVFQEEESQHSAARANKTKIHPETNHRQKPLHLRDYQRKALLAGKGLEVDPEADDTEPVDWTPAQEAEKLREETKRAFHSITNEGESSGLGNSSEIEDLLVPREKTLGKAEQEEEDYQQFLLERVGRDDLQVAFRSHQPQPPNILRVEESNAEDDETFLKNYVLGRGWLDKEAKKIPKYAEIVKTRGGRDQSNLSTGPSGANAQVLGRTVIDETHDDDEDGEFVEQAEEFEAKYNFRFEDAAPTIVTHAREMATSVRRTDDSRKTARKMAEARKRDDKQQRMDELDRLKELKRAALVAKLAIIKKNAGAEDVNLDEFDLDSDFDPDSHDRRMGKAFDNAFYGQEDPDGKPAWDDDIDIDDIIPSHEQEEVEEAQIDFQPGGDAYDPLAPAPKGSKRQKKRQKKNSKKRQLMDEASADEKDRHVDEALQQELIDLEGLSPEERKRQLMEALDEYHKLDYEDVIGDLPTRFKYTKVEPDPLRMTPAEILMATDAELNDIIGLKKLAPYRTIADEKTSTRKKKLKELREKLKARRWGEATSTTGPSTLVMRDRRKRSQNGDQDQPRAKKRKGKKERQKDRSKVETDVVES